MSSSSPPKLGTKAQRRKDVWDRRLEANNALVKVFRKVLIVSAVLAMCQQLVLLGVPIIVQQLLRWLIADDGETYVGVTWAIVLFIVGFFGNGLLTNHYFLSLYVLGMDARTMLNGVTYSKALRLSNKARQSTSTGELVTLMSNDAQRLPDMSLSVHTPWSTGIFIAIAIYLLVRLLGASALAGVLFLLLMIPVQGYLAAKQMGLQRAQMKQTESRVKVINEVLQGIRIVKYYAWEVPFVERISSLRSQEVNKIKNFAFMSAYSMSIMLTTPFVMVMLTLVVYFNGGGNFSPDVVFTAVSLLLVIRFPLMMLPMALASWIQGKVSLGRMQKFFELEELHPADRDWTNRDGNGKGAGSLSVSGRFVWTPAAADDDGDDDGTDVSTPSGNGAGGGGNVNGIDKAGGKDSDAKGGNGSSSGTKSVTTSGKVGGTRGSSGSGDYSSVSARALAATPRKPKAAAVGPTVSVEKGEKPPPEFDLKPALAVGNEGTAVSKTAEAVEVWDLVLDDVQIPAGKLVAVVGQVGSGKSSLVSALLGEMTKVEGRVSVDGSVAYVAQTAWIINATLKDNVLMGRALDEERYQKVLEVCDMKQDLSQLPGGDMTEIGEKGINLSGGQKQRVSIARAAYADADVYIMDDPLSAVDAHVARHLFDMCFTGFLKGKSIILCANQLQFLPQTDLVLVLHEGRVVEQGKYGDLLMDEESSLARLMETFAEDDSDCEEIGNGNEESKAGVEDDGAASVRFGAVENLLSTLPKPRSNSRGTPDEGSRSRSNTNTRRNPSSSSANPTAPSVDDWARSIREVSDTMNSMVEGWTTVSPVSYCNDLGSGGGGGGGGDDGAGVVLSISKFREKSGSYSSVVGSSASAMAHRQGMRGSTPSRQYSDGGGSVASQGGKRSASAVAQEKLTAGGTLQTVEGREEGAVALRVFRIYFRDCSEGWFLPIVLIIVSILTQTCSNAFDYWLSYWSDQYLENGADESWYQYVYAALCVMLVSLYLARALLFAWQAVKSSKHLHAVLCRGVMRAPVSFFDTTPIGRVLNRFTKDMDTIDLLLPRNVPQNASPFHGITPTTLGPHLIPSLFRLRMGGHYLVIITASLPPCGGHQMYYRPVNRDLQRLESVSRSPIFAQFSETLNGVSTLRAYNQQVGRWLGIRLEAMGAAMNLAAALFIVLSKSTGGLSIKGGVAGLVLTYTQQITGYLTWTVRMGCETEARITAVERAQEYADLKPEALPVVDNYRPPKGWPATGAVKLEGIQMRYRPGLDLVLKGVSLELKGGERIGIAGRTGSGKSSLMVALFRIVEPCGGRVTIDGVDALRVGLRDLREAISIIPQDPVMFCGTIRDNLDPFGLADDVTIWAALEAARLSTYVAGLEGKLEAEVSEGGENLSLGQRQLVCLARAVLRRNKILVMDEATANVDVDTDTLIQEAIRDEFSGCTVLTIAHRLNTIMDSDRILVMQDGKVGEFDTPANLVANQRSLLMGFIRQTGVGSSRRLVGIANAAIGSSATDTTTQSSESASPSSSPGVRSIGLGSSGSGSASGQGGGGGDVEEPTTGAAAATAVAAAVAVAGGGGGLPLAVADVAESKAFAVPSLSSAEAQAEEVMEIATTWEGAGQGGAEEGQEGGEGVGEGGSAFFLTDSPRATE
eukprot:jgi/Undpi1/3701/HiC_scaffold_16.g07071.m1